VSVLTCKLRPEGQSVSEEGNATESWLVTVSSKWDHPVLFAGALQLDGYLPIKGGPHWLNPYLRSTGLKFSRMGRSLFHWIASCEYKTLLSEREEEEVERETEPNPLLRRPRVAKSYDRSEHAASKDKDGLGIVNAAGDPWLDPVLVTRSSAVWSVSYNVAASPSWMDTLAGKTNSDLFTIRGRTYAAGTLLFEPGNESELKQEQGVSFYEVSFSLLVDVVDEWKEKRIQNGLNEIVVVGDQAIKRKIKLPTHDEDGNALAYDDAAREPVSDPQLLDANGTLLIDPSPDTAVAADIDKHVRATFGGVLPSLTTA